MREGHRSCQGCLEIDCNLLLQGSTRSPLRYDKKVLLSTLDDEALDKEQKTPGE